MAKASACFADGVSPRGLGSRRRRLELGLTFSHRGSNSGRSGAVLVSFSARVHTSPPGFEPGSLGQEPRILTSKTIADSAKVAANFCTRRRIPKLARHSSLGPWCQHGQERAATVAAAPWRHSVSTVWFHLVGERRTGLKTQFGATVEGCPLRGTGEAGTAKPRGTTRGHPASDLASALPRDQHGPSIRTDPALDPAAARTRRQHVQGVSSPGIAEHGRR